MINEERLKRAWDLIINEEVLERICNMKTKEEIEEFLNQNDITINELQQIGEFLKYKENEDKQLSSQEMENISGGSMEDFTAIAQIIGASLEPASQIVSMVGQFMTPSTGGGGIFDQLLLTYAKAEVGLLDHSPPASKPGLGAKIKGWFTRKK